MENNKFYLEVKGQRKGLLVNIESENCHICTYYYSLALNFNSRYFAKKYIHKNNLDNKYKIIQR